VASLAGAGSVAVSVVAVSVVAVSVVAVSVVAVSVGSMSAGAGVAGAVALRVRRLVVAMADYLQQEWWECESGKRRWRFVFPVSPGLSFRPHVHGRSAPGGLSTPVFKTLCRLLFRC
jgi:hypothetical protein